MESNIKRITEENYEATVKEAGRVLKEGGIVGLPTETVYGLAANRDNEQAMQRLILLKNRPPAKPFTQHLSDPSELVRFSKGPRSVVRRLMERFWPGPLTLILNTHKNESLGVRVPGLQVTRDIIRASGAPIVIPSANPAGENPACDAQEVAKTFKNDVDLIVDDGPAKFKEPSTVVKVDEKTFSILRTGLITEADVLNAACTKVLFVCTGNTCRSPMAEGIFKKLMADKLNCQVEELPYHGVMVQSAGISTSFGGKPSLNAVKALKKWKIDISGHETQPLTKTMVLNADNIYVMTQAHQDLLLNMVGLDTAKTEKLDRRSRDVLDPFGGSEPVYSQCASQIYSNIMEIIETL